MDIQLHLEPEVALFYTRLALHLGVPLGKILSDALLILAGEMSMEALKNKTANEKPGQK